MDREQAGGASEDAGLPPPPEPGTMAKAAPLLVLVALGLALSMLLVFAVDPRVLLRNDTEILLAMDGQLQISGVIMHDGEVIRRGEVRVSVDEKAEDEAVGAVHVGTELITLDGKSDHFHAGSSLKNLGKKRPSILVRADYRGPHAKGQGPALEASAILYSNCPAPFSTEELLRGLSLLVGAALVLVYLFTGHLSERKAQALFATTYCFIFLAVSLPIGGLIVISQKPYLIAMMQKSPLGLVKASTKALEHAQWLINVGGVPVHDLDAEHKLKVEDGADKPETASEPNAAAAEKADSSAAKLDPEFTSAAQPAAARVSAATKNADTAKEAEAQSTESNASNQLKIVGGLAIPFYVLLFAVFGGGINMMRTIPRIQSDHVLGMSESGASFAKQQEVGCDVRKDVIEQYMYLLSAPFLAIAVFYLLQIIATSISEPVLVLMAFSAGLTSELIISTIITFAETTVAKMRPAPESRS
ncbi:MAG: hypothetical protein JWN48_4264 [Myxococcaceae bacterium]|nr:hypothetical protein [Myxococcaceae bacterium]